MRAFHYQEVPAEGLADLPGVTVRWALGRNVGAPRFALRVIELEPGAATERHAHDWEHEVYVLEGAGVVRDGSGGETVLGPGMCVYVAPGEEHQFASAMSQGLRFICVIPTPAA